LGFLNPRAGVPVCETAPNTPPGTISWQDVVMLEFEVPMEWHNGGAYLMNQRTFALLMTMSDALGKPLLTMMPQGQMGFMFAGSPIVIASQMPDIAAGVPRPSQRFRRGYPENGRRLLGFP
jgi:HK97 family phage major capsid protein